MIMAMGLTLTVGSVSAAGELHIYNWGNYTNPEMIEKFEKMHGVKVTIDGYDSNETMLAKVEQGGSGYDIVVPGDYMIAIMIKKGLLERVEPNKMSNFKNIDKKWVDVYWDEGRNYSIPYQWGTTNFTVDSTVYKGDVNTLALLFDPPAESPTERTQHHVDQGESELAHHGLLGYRETDFQGRRPVTELERRRQACTQGPPRTGLLLSERRLHRLDG
jgi:spermidine/putrescine-binding protein